MEPFEVYKLYLAIKLHFTTKSYDVVKYKGKVRVKQETFQKRKDMVSIKKLARDYKREEIIDFLVANFVSGERWGGMFDVGASKRYEDWKIKKTQREYLFKGDVSKILLEMEIQKVSPFYEINGKQGLTFRLYYGRMINIETLVILDKIFNFVGETDDILLEDVVLLVKKYRPFLRVTDTMREVAKQLAQPV
jgi:hypothetical protein|tara:strand:- start:1453 stop:2028 length:576 start_codon:yes stop_codon:yes gene_type:complete